MHAASFRRLLLVVIIASPACISLDRRNPFDPAAPETVRAMATITGRVSLEGLGALTDVTITATQTRVSDEVGRRIDAQAQEDGQFLIEVAAETYNITFAASGHQTQTITGVTLSPGARYDLGATLLTIARGRLLGRVLIQDGTGPARAAATSAPGVAITIVRADGKGAAYTTVTGSDGSYESDGVPAGDYVVRATRDDYAPGYVADAVAVGASERTNVPDLTLYPASAVVHILADGVLGARFTRARTVEAQLLAFVEFLTEMRVSEDPSFADAGRGDTRYRPFAAATPFTLGDLDGTHTIYAQFRDKNGLASEVFSATIVLDRSSPELVSLQAGVSNGFFTATALDLSIAGVDYLSGVRGYQVDLDGDFSDAAETSALASGSSVLVATLVPLGPDGSKTVSVRLVDRAGNVSLPKSLSFVKDTTPPAVSSPSFVVGDGSGIVRALTVPLAFNVTGDRPGEPIYVALGTAPGLSVASPRQAVELVSSVTLAGGADGSRPVCVFFSDAAGNGTDGGCISSMLNRMGALSGTVFVEGEAGGGVDIIVYPEGNPGAALPVFTTVDPMPPALGASFTIANIPSGPRYVLQLSKNGFATMIDRDIDIAAGPTPVDRGRYDLFVAKGAVSGKVELNDGVGNVHGGIVVSDVSKPSIATVTGPDGSWAMNVPVGFYTFQASKQGYIPREYSLQNVTANGSFPLLPNPLKLFAQAGAFRICRAINALCLPAQQASFTESENVILSLSRTTATAFYASLDSGANPNVAAFTPPAPAGDLAGALDGSGNAVVPFVLDALATDGAQDVYVWYLLPANVIDGPVAASITLDRTPPVPTQVTIDAGAKFSREGTPTSAARVTLSLAATDLHSGVSRVWLSNEDESYDDGAPAGADDDRPYATQITDYPLATGEGPRKVHVSFCDAVGNCTCPAAGCAPTDTVLRADGIIVDRTAPQNARFVINDLPAPGLVGAAFTTTPFVALDVDNPLSDAIAVRFSLTNAFDGLAWMPLAGASARIPFVLAGGDGAKIVYGQFIDEAGNTTASGGGALSDGIDLDTTAPSGTVSIDQGGYLGDPDAEGDLDLTLTIASNGAAQMIVHVGQSADFSAETWENVALTKSLSVAAAAGDGLYTAYLRFRDAAGNESLVATDSIVFDTQAPSAASIAALVPVAKDGKKYSQPGAVTYDLFAAGADRMSLAIDGTPLPAQPESFSQRRDITLTASGTARAVSVVFSDFAGNNAVAVSEPILVDGAAPVLVTFAASASTTRDDRVLLTVEATDLGPIEMMLSERPDFLGAGWQALSSPLIWPLATDGDHDIHLKLRDAAGNERTISPITVTRDTSPPTAVTLTLAGGASAVQSPTNVAAVIAATNAADYQLSEDPTFAGVGWTTPPSFPVTTDFDFAAGDGLRTLYLRVRDAAGNLALASDSVTIDTQPPLLPQLVLSSNSPSDPPGYTTSVTVTAALGVVGASAYCVSGDVTGPSVSTDGCMATGWIPAAPIPISIGLTLTGTNATKTVTVKYRDAAGWESDPASASIDFDDTKPTGSVAVSLDGVTLSDGAYVASALVQLDTSASDNASGVAAMAVSNGASCGTSFSTIVPSRSWRLDDSSDGSKQVTVCVRDAAGNVSLPITRSFNLDRQAPQILTFALASGAPFVTSSSGVPVRVVVSESNAPTYQLSEDATFATAAAPAALISPLDTTFDLSAGDGSKFVYVRVRDAAGNVTVASDAIVLDTSSPASPQLRLVSTIAADPPGYASNAGVTAFLSADGATRYCLSGDLVGGSSDGCVSNGWSAGPSLPSSVAITLDSASAGPKTIFVKYRDEAALETGQAVAVIHFDQTPPSGTVALSVGAYAASANVTLTLSASDNSAGVVQMAVANGTSCGSTWVSLATSLAWTLDAATQGDKTVSVCFRDAAGNVSSRAEDTTRLDTLAPTADITLASGSSVVQSASGVAFQVSGSDTNPIEYVVSEAADFAGATWTSFAGAASGTIDLSAGDGTKTVYVRVRDAAGNVTSDFDTVEVDSRAPESPTLALASTDGNDPAGYATTTAVNASLGVVGATYYCLYGDLIGGSSDSCVNDGWSASTSFPTTIAITLSVGNIKKDVRVRYKDAVGWTTNAVLAQITYDNTPPSAGLTLSVGANTNAVELSLAISASDATAGVNQMAVSNGASCGTTFEPFVASRAWVLDASGGDGDKSVTVCVKDAAGNISTPATQTTRLDRAAPANVVLTIAGGASYTTSRLSVPLSFTYTETNTPEYQLSEDPTFSDLGTTWTAAGASPISLSRDLSTGDGLKALYLRVRDAAGNIASTSDTVTLDSKAPEGVSLSLDSAVLADNDGYATTAAVTAALIATGAIEYCFDGPVTLDSSDACVANGWSGTSSLPATVALTLTGGPGNKGIGIYYRDAAGNVAGPVSADIFYDPSPPVVSSATLTVAGLGRGGSGDTQYTRSSNVSVTLAGVVETGSGIEAMQVSENSLFTGALWSDYSTAFSWTLSASDATKTLYARVRDEAGQVSDAFSGSIQLDTTPPTLAFALVGEGAGAAETQATSRNRRVRLALSATDGTGSGVGGTDALRIGDEPSFTGDSWRAYAASLSWDLVDAEIVAAPTQARTQASCHTTILLNEIDPTSGAARIEIASNLSYQVALDGWQLSCGDDDAGPGGTPLATTWTLPRSSLVPSGTSMGYLTVHALPGVSSESDVYMGAACPFNGGAGWVTLVNSLGELVDFVRFNGSTHTPPDPLWTEGAGNTQPVCNAPGETCQRTSLAFDRDYASDWCTASAGGTLGAANSSACGLAAIMCTFVDGSYDVFAEVRDRAGNSFASVDTITLDTSPPYGFVFIENAEAQTGSALVDLFIAAGDTSSGVADMMLSTNASAATTWEPYSTNATLDLGAGSSQARAFVRLRDAAGNEAPGLWLYDDIFRDTIAPEFPASGSLAPPVTLWGRRLADNGSGDEFSEAMTYRHEVAIQIEIGNAVEEAGVSEIMVSEDSGFAGASWRPLPEPCAGMSGVPPSLTSGRCLFFVLSLGDDPSKRVYVKVRDLAGNESTKRSDTIVLDTTPPDAGIVSINSDAAYATGGPLSVRFYMNSAGATAYRLLPGGGAWTACGGGSCDTTTPGESLNFVLAGPPVPQGLTRVQIQARDDAGNVSAPFYDDINVDTLAPQSQPFVVGIAPRTTSAFLSLIEVADNTSQGYASGTSAYHVCVYAQSTGALFSEVDFAVGSGGGWITDLEALDVYFFWVQAFDAAGNSTPAGACPATLPSGFLPSSQVGVSVGLIEGTQKVARLGDRIYSHRGIVMLPRVTDDVSPVSQIVRCDTRRERCQDAGLTTTTQANEGVGTVTKDVAMVSVGNDVWLLRVRNNGGPTHLYATVFDDATDAIMNLSNHSAGFDTGAFAMTSSFVPGTLSVGSNGRMIAVAWWETNVAPRPDKLKVAVCPVATGCRSMDHWLSYDLLDGYHSNGSLENAIADRAWQLNSERKSDGSYAPSHMSLEVGENEIWLSYPYYDGTLYPLELTKSCIDAQHCGFAVLSCSISGSNGCRGRNDWGISDEDSNPATPDVVRGAKMRVQSATLPLSNATAWNYPHAVRAFETDHRLYIVGLSSTAHETTPGTQDRGLFLWRCEPGDAPLTARCRSDADFGSFSRLLQLYQPLLFDEQGLPAQPRVAFDGWGGYLHYSAIDYANGTVFYGRCLDAPPGTDCMTPSNWSNARLLVSGDIRGQADLALVQGNPIVFVGRDATRAFVMEPYTPAPLQRAIVPSFATNGTLATWSVRDGTAADGTIVASNATDYGDPATSLLLAPDVSTSELNMGTGAKYGTVTAYRGFDTGISEPIFGASPPSIAEYRTQSIDENVSPRLSESANCRLALFVSEKKVMLATTPKGSLSPAFYEIEPKRSSGMDEIGELAMTTFPETFVGGAPGKEVVYVAYTYYSYANTPDEVLVMEWYPLGADCVVDTATERKVTLGENYLGMPNATNFRSISLTVAADAAPAKATVHVAFEVTENGPGAADMRLSTCDLATLCNDPTEYSHAKWIDTDYAGGALSYVPALDTLFWVAQLASGWTNPANFHVLRCVDPGATNCDDPSEWTGLDFAPPGITPVALSMGFVPSATTRLRAADLTLANGYLLATSGSRLAWCDLRTGCDAHEDWFSSFYSAELLAASEHALGNLYRAPSGQLRYVGLGNDGHAIAACKDRCWLTDNWVGGFTNKRPEVSVTISSDARVFGRTGLIDDAGRYSAVFAFRDTLNPFAVYWRFVSEGVYNFVMAP